MKGKYRYVAILLSLSFICLETAQAFQHSRCRDVAMKLSWWLWKPKDAHPLDLIEEFEHDIRMGDRIDGYREKAGKTTTYSEFLRAYYARKADFGLQFDRTFRTKSEMELFHTKYLTTIHLYWLNKRLLSEVAVKLAELKGKLSDRAVESIRTFFKERIKSVPESMKEALDTGDPPVVLEELMNFQKALINNHDKNIRFLTYNFERFEIETGLLKNRSKKPDDAPADWKPQGTAKAAKDILERLNSENLLGKLFGDHVFLEEEKRNATVADAKEILRDPDNYYYLKLRRFWQGNRELMAFVLSLSPVDAMIRVIDKYALSKLPYFVQSRVNVRGILLILQSEFSRYIHFPDIQRVIDGHGDAAAKLQLLQTVNAHTNDQLLITFAQQVEAKATWKLIMEFAEKEDPDFHARMVNAKRLAGTGGDMSSLHNPVVNVLVRRAIEVIFDLGVGYYYWPNGDGDDKKRELTREEEKELDEILKEVNNFGEFLKNDPEGRVFVRERIEERKKFRSTTTQPKKEEPPKEEPPKEEKKE